MTENTWPDPARPGVPLHPERDGWHQLYHDKEGLDCALWLARSRCWQLVGVKEHFEVSDIIVRKWRYLGPVLTPDEATALQKRADQAALGHAREAARADQIEFLHKRDVAALQKRVAELEGALKDAAASVKDWGAYASQYLQDKWDLSGEVARYIAIAEGKLPYQARHPMETWKDE